MKEYRLDKTYYQKVYSAVKFSVYFYFLISTKY